MSTLGQRGKVAEKAVEKVLTACNNRVLEFAWHRLPDTRSARSFLQAQPADYYLAVRGRAYHLEVKETEHAYRIGRDRISQVPVLRKFAVAGMPFAVVVFHSTLRKWRCIPGAFFEGEIPPSWDLSQFPLLDSADEALLATGWFTQ